MIDDRCGIAWNCHLIKLVGRMEKRWGDFSQLRDPRFYVPTVMIITALLKPWIENSKIRLCIASGRGAPLPVSVVNGAVIVDKIFRKIAFSPTPIDVEIFDKERCNDHPDAVVHESGSV